jgi:hypothetical protein
MTKKEMEDAIDNHANWIEHLAEHSKRIDAQLEKLVIQIKDNNDSLTEQIKETNRNLNELGEKTDRRIRELNESMDKRISDLVSAIGELIKKL